MSTDPPLRFVSYGGGVQSTALLVLAATRRIDYPIFVMANVGDDSEHPATLDYVRDVASHYAADNGILWLVLRPQVGATPTPPSLVTATALLAAKPAVGG